MNATQNSPKVMKETKNKIRVDFERTSAWTRFKLKYLSLSFLGQLIFKIFRLVLLVGISYAILYPFFAKISSSFMSKADLVDVTVKLIPKNPNLDIYKAIIVDNSYFSALFNTAMLSIFCGLVQTFICTVVGYGFAKFKFRFSGLLFLLVVFTMVVPHETLMLSMFMKFRFFDFFGIVEMIRGESFNLLNTYWPLALLSITGLGFKNGLYIFMMRQFFRGVPDELEESAYIDGSGVFRTFLTIILPLSGSMMITIFLFAFSWQWTDDFYTQVFFTKTGLHLLNDIAETPKSLDTKFAGENMYVSAITNAASLMIITPLIIVYLFCQKQLVQGIERSGIVG
ncbi:MAG: carbohydrate ABC transporter permease [Ruminococcaceae bacterium]|nr:carbohydrate ABC transporter permease [Oscillospiraceae bacterium]